MSTSTSDARPLYLGLVSLTDSEDELLEYRVVVEFEPTTILNASCHSTEGSDVSVY